MSPPARRCLLAVFAHPDDETSAVAGTLIHYARAGVDIHVVTATRGERGDLGTGDLTIARRDLPAVREAELRAVLALYGVHPPILLDYRDHELSTADLPRSPMTCGGSWWRCGPKWCSTSARPVSRVTTIT